MNQAGLASCLLLVLSGVCLAVEGTAQTIPPPLPRPVIPSTRPRTAAPVPPDGQAAPTWPTLPVRTQPIKAMKLLAVDTGWTLAGNRLSMTHDNGKRWIDITPPALKSSNQYTGPYVADVGFVDPAVGHLLAFSPPVDEDDEQTGADHVGHYDLLSTTDGGASWTSHALPRIDDSLRLTGTAHMSFINDREGVISMDLCGDTAMARDTELYITSDGGAKWKRIETPLNENIYGVLYTNSRLLWVVGAPSPFDIVSESTLIFSRDAGATFNKVVLPGPPEMESRYSSTYSLPSFTDAKSGYERVQYGAMIGSQEIAVEYKTVDGGISWKASAKLADLPDDFEKPMTVVGGQWTEVYQTGKGAQPKAIRPEAGAKLAYPSTKEAQERRCVASFLSLQTGWSLCGGTLASTTDGGETWSFVLGG